MKNTVRHCQQIQRALCEEWALIQGAGTAIQRGARSEKSSVLRAPCQVRRGWGQGNHRGSL